MTVVGPACFRYDSAVFFDEMDPLGVMHNSRFAVHVERAQSALFEQLGYGWTDLSRGTRTSATWSVTSPSLSPRLSHPRGSCRWRWSP